MEKGICNVSVASLRAENSHQSELTSQILYGETVDILDSVGDFFKVKMHFDGYEGFVSTNQISLVSEEFLSTRKTEVLQESCDFFHLPEGRTLLSVGSEIPSETSIFAPQITPAKITETAKQFLNVPYLWSGRSFFGIDCSGFVQLVFKLYGIYLPRNSFQQAEIGEVLSFVEESKPGDLAFFENEDGQICHVGIMLNHQEIIHAFGKVRIDSLDSTGIYNQDLKKHTHKLRFLRSIF